MGEKKKPSIHLSRLLNTVNSVNQGFSGGTQELHKRRLCMQLVHLHPNNKGFPITQPLHSTLCNLLEYQVFIFMALPHQITHFIVGNSAGCLLHCIPHNFWLPTNACFINTTLPVCWLFISTPQLNCIKLHLLPKL